MDNHIIFNESEIKTRFTWVRLNINRQGSEKIIEFLRNNSDFIKTPRKNFHSTFFYSVENPIFFIQSIPF